MRLLLAITIVFSAATAVAAPNVRAIVIGTNTGLAHDAPLSFAQADARAVYETLIDTGAVDQGRAELHLGVDTERVRDALALAGGEADTLLFFLSSHGGAHGAHLDGSLLRWAELSDLLSKTRARVVVAFVDACQSGALLTPKGFERGERLTVSLAPAGARGRILIASSGANEIATESIRLQGSPFVHHLVTALRGAGDTDDDGRITVAETYAYVYQRTIASTANARTGPQHPTRRIELNGADDVVLAVPRGDAVFARTPGASSTCLVLDVQQIRVLAEIPPDRRVRVAPGRYVVKCIREDGVDVATIDAGAGVTNVDTAVFERTALTYALAKGPRARPRAQVGLLGSYVSGGWPGLALVARFGDRTLEANALAAVAPDRGAVVAAGGAFTVPWFGGEYVRLAVGLDLGARLDARVVDRSAIFFGQMIHLDIEVGPVTIAGRFDLATAYVPADEDVYVFTMLSIGVAHDL